MSRSIVFGIFVVLLPVCLLISGCSKKPSPEEEVLVSEAEAAPNKTLERLFTSLQFEDIEGAETNFSKQVPVELAKKFIGDFNKKRKLGEFKTLTSEKTKSTATVEFIYNYQEKDPKTGELDLKRIVERGEMFLVREGKEWKIRRTGNEDFDESVEKSLFYSCLSAVMDVTIAEEKLRLQPKRKSYSNNLAGLMKIYPINETACRSITIDEAGRRTYLVVAMTRNTKPCRIEANTDVHTPEKYEECLSR